MSLIAFGTLNRCEPRMETTGPVSDIRDRDCRERLELLNDTNFVRSLDGLVYSSNKPFSDDKKTTWQIIAHLEKVHGNLPIAVLGGYLNTVRDCSELINRFNSFAACKDPDFVSFTPFNEREQSSVEEVRVVDYVYLDKARLLCPSGTLDSCEMEAKGEPRSTTSLTYPWALRCTSASGSPRSTAKS